MDWNVVLGVVKWVGIVLVAGFIGKFGKSFAIHLIERRKKRKQKEIGEAQKEPKNEKMRPEAREILSNLEKIKAQAIRDRENAKTEKKKAKAQAKIEKKRQ